MNPSHCSSSIKKSKKRVWLKQESSSSQESQESGSHISLESSSESMAESSLSLKVNGLMDMMEKILFC